ncbi:Gp15 family bacteriophage protein [Paenibacillus sp. FSL K6-2524]|uniref:Gp15 family bacteriophage protein n=1 Tax=Paenibacillus sp. FSL K6-2524 TaxID=2954516 RepID=UPI0030F8916F
MRPDFNGDAKKSKIPQWYDLYDDWGLIEASIAAQYGIRLRSVSDMSWDEFCTLLAGIMPETPLGQIVNIRSENDREKIKAMSPEQRRIRSEWRTRGVKEVQWTEADKVKAMQEVQQMFIELSGAPQ